MCMHVACACVLHSMCACLAWCVCVFARVLLVQCVRVLCVVGVCVRARVPGGEDRNLGACLTPVPPLLPTQSPCLAPHLAPPLLFFIRKKTGSECSPVPPLGGICPWHVAVPFTWGSWCLSTFILTHGEHSSATGFQQMRVLSP